MDDLKQELDKIDILTRLSNLSLDELKKIEDWVKVAREFETAKTETK